jgi:hypothetical protein
MHITSRIAFVLFHDEHIKLTIGILHYFSEYEYLVMMLLRL